MIYRILTVTGMLIFSFAFASTDNLENTINSNLEVPASMASIPAEADNSATSAETIYNEFSKNSATLPTMNVFEKAMRGYDKLEEKGVVKNNLLTVVDFGLSSTKKRMWIMDMNTKMVLFHTYVSHGKNTGGEFATNFSNTVNSLQSSLGFYVTGETYYGKNGLSLFIDGMEKGFNTKARERYVVIHGADYAEPSFIDRLGRLGRSYGCPAVPNTVAKDLIGAIKGESVVYIHKDDKNYLENSTLLN